ncbi:YdeI/OmpD-associated family protein [Camelimonas sp. ID_303_24]
MMIVDIEDFFTRGCGRCNRFDTPDCATRPWETGLRSLRAICLGAGLTEAVKWAHPCYMHGQRNIAIIGAFRNDFRLCFFNAALMRDPEAVLERQGQNTRSPDMIRFTSNDDVARLEPVIHAYLREAIGYAREGVKPARDTGGYDMPAELSEALDADPALAEAFHALTPGRQKSYVINLSSAKQAETRLRRIAGFRDRILAGKGAMER